MTTRLLALLLLLLSPSSGLGDDALVRAQQHMQTGVARMKAQKYAEAVQEFAAAFALKPIPRAAIHLAEAQLGAGDKAGALQNFQLFLRIARLSDPERPAIEKRIAELAVDAPAAAPVDTENDLAAPEPLPEDRVDTGKPKKAGPLPITHTPPSEIAGGQSIPIVAEVPRAADAVLVWLYYRSPGDAEFKRISLEPQGNAQVTAIPGKDVRGSAVQYYLEARDGGGRVSAASGSPASPHLVVVQGGAKDAPAKGRVVRMSRARKWFWGTLAAAGVLLATGTVTALLAKDREDALEQRAEESRALAEKPGQHPALFDAEAVRLENEGQDFEAVSVMSFALGTAFLGTAGTLWYFDRAAGPRRAPGAQEPPQPVLTWTIPSSP